jgi:hypothetical protein
MKVFSPKKQKEFSKACYKLLILREINGAHPSNYRDVKKILNINLMLFYELSRSDLQMDKLKLLREINITLRNNNQKD